MLVNQKETNLNFKINHFRPSIALDAYCLMEIYDVIETEFNRIEIDFNEFINTFLTEKKSRIVLKKSVPSANSQKKSATTVQSVGPNPDRVG